MSATTLPPSPLPDVRVFGDPHLHTDGDLVALAFAADGSLWSAEDPGVVRHSHPASGRQPAWHSLSDLDTLWCFSSDARLLASASNDLSVWDVASGNLLSALPQPSWVTALAFHPDATFLASGHDDGRVCYWDAAGQLLV